MNKPTKIISIFLIVIAIAAIFGYLFKDTLIGFVFRPTASTITTRTPVIPGLGSEKSPEETVDTQPEIVAESLEIPWEIVFLPDQSLLVTQRSGSIVRISQNSKNAIPIFGVVHRGEGGLLGMALHPDFTENQWIYIYLTTQGNNQLINRVERYRFVESQNTLTERKVILENIPGAANHDGGRIAFGPDGLLYITTGDAQDSALAQDTTSLAGKILRLTDEGEVPSDNPFNNPVYSYGHRNPQGIAWDEQGRLWESEHGPSGTASGFDEVNLIVKGANYGWPTIQGDKTAASMRTSIIQSGSSETWAPADLEVAQGKVLFTGLRGETLYVATITGERLENTTAFFRQEYGRLRVVTMGPDNWVYFSTSNTDGRGDAKAGDDTIYRIKLDLLQ